MKTKLEKSLMKATNHIKKKRSIQLDYHEKERIYILWRSGHYYMNELCDKCNISKHTLLKVVHEVAERFNERI